MRTVAKELACLTVQTREDDHKAVGGAAEASVRAWLIALSMESGQKAL